MHSIPAFKKCQIESGHLALAHARLQHSSFRVIMRTVTLS